MIDIAILLAKGKAEKLVSLLILNYKFKTIKNVNLISILLCQFFRSFGENSL